jgi:hypothetical protein
MRTPLLLASSLLVLLPGGPAVAQGGEDALPIASLTCADIAKVPADYQAALIYYAAGYRDGLDYARASLTVPTQASKLPLEITAPAASSASSSEVPPASSANAAAASSAEGDGNSGGEVVAGLTLQSADIVTACAAAPHAFLTDIISDHGGARGLIGATTPAPQTFTTPAPANGAAGATLPANGTASQPAATDNSGAAAVSSDLGAAGQQLQQNTGGMVTPQSIPGASPPAATGPGAGAGATSP